MIYENQNIREAVRKDFLQELSLKGIYSDCISKHTSIHAVDFKIYAGMTRRSSVEPFIKGSVLLTWQYNYRAMSIE
jgi:hypothetical protein